MGPSNGDDQDGLLVVCLPFFSSITIIHFYTFSEHLWYSLTTCAIRFGSMVVLISRTVGYRSDELDSR